MWYRWVATRPFVQRICLAAHDDPADKFAWHSSLSHTIWTYPARFPMSYVAAAGEAGASSDTYCGDAVWHTDNSGQWVKLEGLAGVKVMLACLIASKSSMLGSGPYFCQAACTAVSVYSLCMACRYVTAITVERSYCSRLVS